jgi:hypothetical protein
MNTQHRKERKKISRYCSICRVKLSLQYKYLILMFLPKCFGVENFLGVHFRFVRFLLQAQHNKKPLFGLNFNKSFLEGDEPSSIHTILNCLSSTSPFVTHTPFTASKNYFFMLFYSLPCAN